MCVDVAGVRLLEAAAERCRSSSALFPEHRYVSNLGLQIILAMGYTSRSLSVPSSLPSGTDADGIVESSWRPTSTFQKNSRHVT
jgi:hypothetical protein